MCLMQDRLVGCAASLLPHSCKGLACLSILIYNKGLEYGVVSVNIHEVFSRVLVCVSGLSAYQDCLCYKGAALRLSEWSTLPP